MMVLLLVHFWDSNLKKVSHMVILFYILYIIPKPKILGSKSVVFVSSDFLLWWLISFYVW